MTATLNNSTVQILLGSRTDLGKVRTTNEDSAAALLPPNAPTGCGGLMIVCDGMGGHQAGEYASSLAVNTVVSELKNASTDSLSPPRASETLRNAAIVANSSVFSESNSMERAGMGTTLTAAVVTGPVLAIAHVGDSRAYLLRAGKLAQLTADHTWVADRVQKGDITPAEAETHPKRNVLLRALGVGENVVVDSSMIQIQEDDVILLSSDGLHGLVNGADMASILNSLKPQEAASELVDRANAAGGPDNVTAVVARILSTDPEATNPGHESSVTMTDGFGLRPRVINAVRKWSRRT